MTYVVMFVATNYGIRTSIISPIVFHILLFYYILYTY